MLTTHVIIYNICTSTCTVYMYPYRTVNWSNYVCTNPININIFNKCIDIAT